MVLPGMTCAADDGYGCFSHDCSIPLRDLFARLYCYALGRGWVGFL